MFSYGSSRSTSFAIVTPSFVMVGAPHFFSKTTFLPFGPSVTFTTSASLLTPASSPFLATSLKTNVFLAMNFSSYLLTFARISLLERIRYSVPSTLISVPPYFE